MTFILWLIVGGILGWLAADDLGGGNWGLFAFAKNLFDEEYRQVAFDAPIQGSGTTRAVQANFIPRSTQLFGAFLGEPRTFGLTLMPLSASAAATRPWRRNRCM